MATNAKHPRPFHWILSKKEPDVKCYMLLAFYIGFFFSNALLFFYKIFRHDYKVSLSFFRQQTSA
jgi:hypothetical protein